jgi:hypothetical protein
MWCRHGAAPNPTRRLGAAVCGLLHVRVEPIVVQDAVGDIPVVEVRSGVSVLRAVYVADREISVALPCTGVCVLSARWWSRCCGVPICSPNCCGSVAHAILRARRSVKCSHRALSGAVAATCATVEDGVATTGYVRDVIERVTPCVLAARAVGLTEDGDVIAERVRHMWRLAGPP